VKNPQANLVHCLVFAAGFAALSWEVLWQLQATLALGASARGTAIVLATVMAGMSGGALLAGRVLRDRELARPLRAYALLEFTIGVCGIFMLSGFRLLEQVDRFVYQSSPGSAAFAHAAGTAVVIGFPSLAMGATIPILGLVAQRYQVSLSRLYAVNTVGAAVGCLSLAFLVLPRLGVFYCTLALASVNFLVAGLSFVFPAGEASAPETSVSNPASAELSIATVRFLVVLTGFITFALEVSWFRSLRAAFQATSESFALMLASVLLALAVGARLASSPRLSKLKIQHALFLAGSLIIVATPAIERFDLWTSMGKSPYLIMMGQWFGLSLMVMGPPMALAGLVLPRLLDRQTASSGWARLYALNTAGAIAGSLLAAWVLLPVFGSIETSIYVGALTLLSGAFLMGATGRFAGVMTVVVLSLLAFTLKSGVGIQRVQGRVPYAAGSYKVLKSVETPDSTVTTVELSSGNRTLLIDGFEAAGEREGGAFYMEWMGRLPMLMHPEPKNVLVICFGTGQTVNGARREGPDHIDVVDISATVFTMADFFPANEGVLDDPRVHPHVMDGRAWLRRTSRKYDVITLEPMPPNFAGVNNLYSKEFYDLCYERLNEGGIVAQWLPFQLVPTFHSASVATTFEAVFPNSGLWLDPRGLTGILVGRKGDTPIQDYWPGYDRQIPRSLTKEQVEKSMYLYGDSLKRYTALGEVITDDNQLLNHGLWRIYKYGKQKGTNLCVVLWASSDPPPKVISSDVVSEDIQIEDSELREVPPYQP
jgi:spermidine synthase